MTQGLGPQGVALVALRSVVSPSLADFLCLLLSCILCDRRKKPLSYTAELAADLGSSVF